MAQPVWRRLFIQRLPLDILLLFFLLLFQFDLDLFIIAGKKHLKLSHLKGVLNKVHLKKGHKIIRGTANKIKNINISK